MAIAEPQAAYRLADLPLVNWFAAAFPAAAQWEQWLAEVAGALLRRPAK